MKPLNILGLAFFFTGILTMGGYGLYMFFRDANVPPVIRFGITAIILGIIILLISLAWDRSKENNQ